jgi:triosephosphate isomerase
MRKPIIAGNWKMNKTVAEARDLVAQILRELGDFQGVDVVLCPPFTAMAGVSEAITGSLVDLGAQNMHANGAGAYTGEIGAPMLRELFCHYVILGHSERRTLFGESDGIVNEKVESALNANLQPIVCVGETMEERDSGAMADIVERQVRGSLRGLPEEAFSSLILAYEPVWAIGTGRTATPEQAQEVHALIRSVVASMAGESVAESLRIQYGGSVKPDNAADLFSQNDIDGGLIGGASLDARSFAEIVRAGAR